MPTTFNWNALWPTAPFAAAVLLGIAASGVGSAAPPLDAAVDTGKAAKAKTIFETLPISIAVKQRSTTAVSGSSGALSLTVGDITGGQVMVTLIGTNNAALLGPLSMKPGDSARFRLGEADYALQLTRLDNALVGDDFAAFVIEAKQHDAYTPAETIGQLIRIVENTDAVFIRSGVNYPAAEAAEHLRTKLRAAKGDLTASEFIEQIASRSSLTGEEYVIRFPDGRTLPAGAFLRDELIKLEQGDENTPAATYEILENVSLPCRDADGIALGDLTGNGKIDIVASEGKHLSTVWFEQGEDWRQWTKHVIYTGQQGGEIEGNALGDFDGDGRLEAISLNQSRGEIYLHCHGGDPRKAWKTAVIQTGRPWLQDALVTDVDGDGRADLVYTWEGRTASQGGVHWLKLAGDDPLAAESWRDHVMAQHESAWWLLPRRVDLTGNGHALAIVFTARRLLGRNPGSRAGLYWMTPGDDVTAHWQVHTIDDTLPHPLHVDAGDLSGAGHGLDLVVSGFDTDTVYWYEFSRQWKRHALPSPDLDGGRATKVWNVKTIATDGDRDAVLAIINRRTRGGMYLFNPVEGGFQPSLLREHAYDHPMDDRILLHDLSGDGRLECLIPDSGPGVNQLHIFRIGQRS